jgi:hypothetical protein
MPGVAGVELVVKGGRNWPRVAFDVTAIKERRGRDEVIDAEQVNVGRWGPNGRVVRGVILKITGKADAVDVIVVLVFSCVLVVKINMAVFAVRRDGTGVVDGSFSLFLQLKVKFLVLLVNLPWQLFQTVVVDVVLTDASLNRMV